jgi:hypothetical protein
MSSPVYSVVTRFAYGIRQLPRVAWYLGHGLALRRLSEVARQREGSQSRARRRSHTDAPVPDRDYIYSETIRLFMQDLANVEAGIYPVPADHDGSLLTMIARGSSSKIFQKSIDAGSAGHTTKSSARKHVESDPPTICKISIFSRAAG